MLLSRCAMLTLLPAMAACSRDSRPTGDSTPSAVVRPDERPVMINKVPPFHYPPELYAQKVQGNVTLRLFIDVSGLTVPDSTRVEEPSGYPAFDSAAVVGSRDLQFVPAKLGGEPLALTILFPVYFRHPEGPPLASDSVLRRKGG